MNKNYGTIQDNVAAVIGDTTTSMRAKIGTFVNNRYRDLLSRNNWQMIADGYTFNTVASTTDYVLPDNFRKEISVLDSTNDVQLSHISLQEFIDTYASAETDSGTPANYTIFDRVARAQPTAASVLAIVSSSTADTTQTIRVTGVSSGVIMSENVTLNGTTPANTSNSYTEVLAVSKSAATTGKVTITSNSAAVTVAVIAPAILELRTKICRLYPIPSAVITIKMPYIMAPLPLSSDYDYTPFDCADALELGAIADAWRAKRQFAKADTFEQKYEYAITNLTWDAENQNGRLHLFLPATYDRNYV